MSVPDKWLKPNFDYQHLRKKGELVVRDLGSDGPWRPATEEEKEIVWKWENITSPSLKDYRP